MPEIPAPLSHTVEAIYRVYEAKTEKPRSYLGASTFGTECDRAWWYNFRHACDPEKLEGRKRRLFQTGHREELRIIDDLRAAGLTVEEIDPSTGKQWAISSVGGHLRGHLDGLVSNVPEAPQTLHVLEIKTHNEKSFKALVKDKVEKSKPGHFAQMQIYMHHKGVDRALYVAVNKNDDSLYVERVHYDAAFALRLVARAERVIRSDVAPSRLHDDVKSKAAYGCQWCPALALCHEGQWARRNCRTCISATAVVDASDRGAWRCELQGKELSFDEQQAGCSSHRFLPSIVPGEQTDADEATRTITYQLNDGTLWTDGGDL
ncbi:hypothetical protein ABIF96_005768 [Bradyrhizobium ottawaense]|uniref:oxidoreductase n=1 Tax=Bradyrhizobium ottawaense TaxID=931866 RepID=UPI003838E6F2